MLDLAEIEVPKSVADLKAIPPGWYGVAFGAAAAGATMFTSHKVIAGVLLAAAVLVLAHNLSKPCCSACAGAPTKEDPHQSPPTWNPTQLFTDSATVRAGGCAS